MDTNYGTITIDEQPEDSQRLQVSRKEIMIKAFKRSVCLRFPDSLRIIVGCESKVSMNVANGLGFLSYFLCILLIYKMGWKELSSIISIKPDFDDQDNICHKLLMMAGFSILNFLNEIGTAKDSIEARNEREEARNEREEARLFRLRADAAIREVVKERKEAQRFRRQGRSYFSSATKERKAAEAFRNEGQASFAHTSDEIGKMEMFRADLSTYCMTLAQHQIMMTNDH